MIVVINATQFHSRKAEISVCAVWYPVGSLWEVRGGETYDSNPARNNIQRLLLVNSFSRTVHHHHHYQRDRYSISMDVMIWKSDCLLDKSESKTRK